MGQKPLSHHFHHRSKAELAAVVARTVLLIAVYFTFSIGLTFYQKKLIREFTYPLSVVVCHVIIKFCLASACRAIAGFSCPSRCRCLCCRKRNGSGGRWRRRECPQKERVVLGWNMYCRAVAVTAISSAFDVGFSNWSFEFITVSLYTMTKSTSIIFILMFSVCLGLERPRASLGLIVACIAGGLVLFNYESTQFHLGGFILVLSASFLSGIRWSYAQFIMQSPKHPSSQDHSAAGALSNPIDMVYHVQPWMLIALLPFSASVEGLSLATSASAFAAPTTWTLMTTLGKVGLGAVVAFAMESSEYLLVSQTSSLTLSVAGVWKEILTLFLDFRINRSRFSGVNIMGLVLCFAGIIVHLVVKFRDAEDVEEDSETVTPSASSSSFRELEDHEVGDEVALLDMAR